MQTLNFDKKKKYVDIIRTLMQDVPFQEFIENKFSRKEKLLKNIIS